MPADTITPYLEKWGLPQTQPTMLAYFAGLFDGEGCIQLSRTPARKKSKNPEGGVGLNITVSNTCPEPLGLLKKHFGGSVTDKVMSERGWSRAYYWIASGKRAAWFLSQIVEHLVIKREQAEAVLLFAETYFAGWRHCEQPGWPLTQEGIRLRRLAFHGFRAAMDSKTGRGISWCI